MDIKLIKEKKEGKNYQVKFKKKNLFFGISKASDGNMKFHEDDNDKNISANRKIFLKKQEISLEQLVSCRLAQSANVAVVNQKDGGKIIDKVDGLITKDKNLCLSVTVADCLPIYFFDQKKEVIGVFHAGYKGILKNGIKSMINKMSKNFHSSPSDILVYIGPYIKGCHFEITGDLINRFSRFKEFVIEKEDRIFVDLGGIVKKELVKLGLKSNNIEISQECTHCKREYFSFRRDKPEKVDAQIAYIFIKPN